MQNATRAKRGASLLAIILLLVGAQFHASSPATAFELFGYTLFGEDDDGPAADTIDPVAYEVTLALAGADSDLQETLETNSILFRQQQVPPSGTVGLVARARDDRTRLIAALYETGRYAGVVDISIAGRDIDRIGLTETLSADGAPVPVRITVDAGPLFHFGTVIIEGGDGTVDQVAIAERAGLVSGNVARSTIVRDTSVLIVAAWAEVGHPFADVVSRRIVADHDSVTVDVTLTLDAGPEAVFGSVTVEGADEIDPAFVARHADIPQGQLYDSRLLERARRNLRRLEALGGIAIDTADRVGPGGQVPIVITITERKPRVVNAGATFSSTEGAAVEASWRHRNLFGQSETLRLEGAVGRIFEASELNDLDARALIEFHKPGVFNARTDLNVIGGFIQEDPDPYHREAFFTKTMITHRTSDHLTLRGGVEVDLSRIDDAFGRDKFTLVGVPLVAEYDTRDNPLDATEGVFVRMLGEPFAHRDAAFVRAEAEVRHYRALDADQLMVLALRGQIGTIAGASLTDIPAHRRFYAGGAGSVRGYDFYDVGPSIAGIGPTGGRALAEGSIELRVRLTETIGVVPFFDAGLVSIDPTFQGADEFQSSAGIGLRYFTAVGPIRLDVAVPINPRPGDPAVAFYFGIGQAF